MVPELGVEVREEVWKIDCRHELYDGSFYVSTYTKDSGLRKRPMTAKPSGTPSAKGELAVRDDDVNLSHV